MCRGGILESCRCAMVCSACRLRPHLRQVARLLHQVCSSQQRPLRHPMCFEAFEAIKLYPKMLASEKNIKTSLCILECSKMLEAARSIDHVLTGKPRCDRSGQVAVWQGEVPCEAEASQCESSKNKRKNKCITDITA